MADDKPAIMATRSLAEGIAWQARHSDENGAPVTGRMVRAMLGLMGSDTATGRRIANWPGYLLEDAMPLRLAGGFHHLHLTGTESRLAPIYAGEITDQREVDAVVLAITQKHDAALLPWFDGPPQTNEAARSSSIMAGLLWLSEKLGPKFELNELGASAGANTMIERYAYDLGGVKTGPANSPVRIQPEWRGPPPPDAPVDITEIEGCDQAPINLADPAQALRLTAYVWPENTARLARIKQVIALASQNPPRLTQADAADWVEHRLSEPQEAGITRVFYHSIVWQYIPPERRARIEAAMAAAGAKATPQRPLAWIMLETNRATFRHELRIRYWPGGGEWQLLGEAQAHGAWVEWH